MKKIIQVFAVVLVAVLMSGCDWNQVENTWSKGKELGKKHLSEETKAKLKPLVNKTETVYIKVKVKKAVN